MSVTANTEHYGLFSMFRIDQFYAMSQRMKLLVVDEKNGSIQRELNYRKKKNGMARSRQPAQTEAHSAHHHFLEINLFVFFFSSFLILLFIFTVIFAFVYVSPLKYVVRRRTSHSMRILSIYLPVICDFFCVE